MMCCTRSAEAGAGGSRAALGVLVAAWLLAPAAAHASVPDVALTLDDPVPYSITGSSGVFEPYSFATDGVLDFDNDAICLSGDCNVPDQDWLIFRVDVLSGSLDETAVAALFEDSNGAGYFQGGIGTAPDSADATTNADTPNWLFTSLTGKSALLFAVYDDGLLPSGGGPFGAGATNLIARVGGSGDEELGFANTQVPEPSTALLMAVGLTCLARFSRESGKRR